MWSDVRRYLDRGVLPHGAAASDQDPLFWQAVSVVQVTLDRMREGREAAARRARET